jgi:hypothetical protein
MGRCSTGGGLDWGRARGGGERRGRAGWRGYKAKVGVTAAVLRAQ